MTFTKEQLIEQAKKNLATHRTAINNPLAQIDAELFRMALAGMEAEPAAYMIGGHYLMHAQDPKVDNYASAVPLYTAPHHLTTSERAELENYRNAQQVVPDERVAFNAWNNDADCPLAGLTVKQAAWLSWLKRSGIIKSFEPVTYEFEVWAKSEGLIHDSYGLRTVNNSADVARKAWNACRAAMLQGKAEPVTTAYKLPELSYLDIVKFNADCALQDPESIYAQEFFMSLDEVFGERGNYTEPVQAKAVSILIAEIFRLRGYPAAPQQEAE